MKFPVSPFLVPAEDTVRHYGWDTNTAEPPTPLPNEMEHWDYQTEMSLTGSVLINVREMLQQCHMDPGSRLGVVVTAKSSKTNVEFPVAQTPINSDDECEVFLECLIPGAELGGRLTLETMIVALRPIPTDALAPKRAGSVLWRETHHTHLQGIGTQFPTDAEDFALTRPDIAKAGWKLTVDTTDLETMFMSAVRLTLNSGHPAIAKLLAGSKGSEARQIQRLIDIDVTRQLVAIALGCEEVREMEVDWKAVSVGGVLRNLLQQIWPTGEDPQTLRSWQLTDPSRIESHIQHVRGILG